RFLLAPALVHVVREEVPGLAGVQHHVSLGDLPAQGVPHLADLVVLQVAVNDLHARSLLASTTGTSGPGPPARAPRPPGPPTRGAPVHRRRPGPPCSPDAGGAGWPGRASGGCR